MTRMLVVAVPLALCASSAEATTMLRVETADLARRSELVVRGTVQRIDSHWTGDRRRIVTDIVLQVSAVLKGSPAQTVVIEQQGGLVEGIGQRVEGVASFSAGEEVVVFLERRLGDRYLLTGMAQGKFKVERSSDGRAVYVIPEDLGETLVLDPVTRQPVASRAAAQRLEALEKLVKATGAP
jgi:hypothetical protein